MASSSHYVIRGGLEGRERLRVLSRVMHATTSSLFDRLGLRDGLQCRDAGCGGGDATLELARRAAPRGSVVGVDIGYLNYPESRAFRTYHELYCETVVRRGGDPNIGPRLPLLLRQRGFDDISVAVVQPVALHGEAKLLNPLTMENIAGAVLEDGLSSREEIEEVVRDLYEFAANPDTIAGTPRVVQVWARRPAA